MKNELDTIIRGFQLKGLHGYKDLEITCKDKASIFLAENGAGKTTLLNVLYALLTGKLHRLISTGFEEAIIDTRIGELRFNKSQAFGNTNPTGGFDFSLIEKDAHMFLRYGISRADIESLVVDYISSENSEIRLHSVYNAIFRDTPLHHKDIGAVLEKIKTTIIFNNDYFSNFRKQLSAAMGKTAVLYLPTYRRIEANSDDVNLSKKSASNPDWDSDFGQIVEEVSPANDDGDQLIYFGLGDVEEKLNRMTRFIRQSIIEAYAKLSGNMLDALLGTRSLDGEHGVPPDFETIRLILGRLGKNEKTTEELIRRALNQNSHQQVGPLSYFLGQLLESYENSRPQELLIENFIEVVNGYFKSTSEEKSFKFDKVKLKVNIWHDVLEKSLPYDSLSSGEKQIVSIFSRLILEKDKNYIILIDEPELSLSIKWQSRFIPDILKTDSCAQLLAITHSPFIFDNDLDSSAKSIFVSTSKKK